MINVFCLLCRVRIVTSDIADAHRTIFYFFIFFGYSSTYLHMHIGTFTDANRHFDKCISAHRHIEGCPSAHWWDVYRCIDTFRVSTLSHWLLTGVHWRGVRGVWHKRVHVPTQFFLYQACAPYATPGAHGCTGEFAASKLKTKLL